MRKTLLSALAALLFPSLLQANDLQCRKDGLCTFTRRLYNDQNQRSDIPYFFKYRAAKNGAPTLVFIPGGPGETSIQRKLERTIGLVSDYGLILTDPRFTGANQHPNAESFSRSMTSEAVAQDLAAALKKTGVQDYVLYGVSYGTVPATILASRAKSYGLPQPRAVVLDGTVGRMVEQGKYVETFLREWQRLSDELGQETLSKFTASAERMIQDGLLTRIEMASIVRVLLNLRTFRGENLLKLAVTTLAAGKTDFVEQAILQARSGKTKQSSRFRKIVGCREIFAHGSIDSYLFEFDGGLKAIHQDDCAPIISVYGLMPYDSHQYPIHSPIIYLQGEKDPSTPLEQSEYHAQGQPHAQKFVVLVKDGGHEILPSLTACAPAFWAELGKNPIAAAKAMDACTGISK